MDTLSGDRDRPMRDAPLSSTLSSDASGVSWAAIIAGAAGAAALSLILLILGAGLGLSSISPWSHQGMAAATFGVSTILWLSFTQLAASGIGGYLAGRLRLRWTGAHVDEVYFRDTAHGFLAWAVATLATAAFLTSAIGSLLGTGVQAGAAAVGGAGTAVAATAGASDSASKDSSAPGLEYFVDSLFRRDAASATSASTTTTSSVSDNSQAAAGKSDSSEVSRIFLHNLRVGQLPQEDTKYLGQLVAQRTGLSQADAEKRVTDVYTRSQTALNNAQTQAREAADKARKATTYALLWMFVALLIGAFVASLSATYGGRRRDL